MSVAPYPRYSKEEFARRGNEIYEREVQPHLSAQGTGKFVAIDIKTSAFETDADEIAASHRLLARHPEAQILVPVGRFFLYPSLRPRTAA
jgi:hypothetical protein